MSDLTPKQFNRRIQHLKNKDKYNAKHKEWMIKNKDRVKAYNKKYHQEHREHSMLQSKLWRANNKEYYRASYQKFNKTQSARDATHKYIKSENRFFKAGLTC